jgi:hypothetical protein
MHAMILVFTDEGFIHTAVATLLAGAVALFLRVAGVDRFVALVGAFDRIERFWTRCLLRCNSTRSEDSNTYSFDGSTLAWTKARR